MQFLKGSKEFVRNPLGIIALFISLIYGFATLLLDSAAKELSSVERWPIIGFIVLFPLMVLITFYRLVTKHHGKLYGPGDFRDDSSFLRTLSQEEQETKLDKEVKESLGEDVVEDSETAQESKSSLVENDSDDNARKSRIEEHQKFRSELYQIEKKVIEQVATDYGVKVETNIAIGGTEAVFDAMLIKKGTRTFIEVKALRHPTISPVMLDRILYHSVIADKYFRSNFKLILVVVYYFSTNEMNRVERYWRRKLEKCPVDIELRIIPKSELGA